MMIKLPNYESLCIYKQYTNSHYLLYYNCKYLETETVEKFMVFNATFNNISVIYRVGQFYWERKPEYPEKTTVNNKPYTSETNCLPAVP